ncbi:MAG: Nramp family divalent metal transporter [Planctomycetaceae bacterium]|nr:Nramp family divalent metal transporter [Planctomycetaceae bacterium]
MPAAKQLDEFLAWDEPLLTAWDLRLASAEENGSSETESTNPLIAPLERRVDTWLTEQRQATSAALNRLPSNERDSLFDAYAKAFPTSPNQTPAELEANRDELRLRLRELNSDRFEAEIASRQQAGALPAELNERQRRRLERGHEILAEELTLVSIQRSWRDVARALVAQRDASAASRELKSIAEDDPLRPLAGVEARHAAEQVNALTEPWTWDDKWWAAVVTFLTIGLLANGRYGIIQNLSTVLVVLFTFLTVGNAISLQTTEQWSLSASTLLRGLSFGLPESGAGLKMALATFGIIGVGATELITYPYWCIEKGYARYTGWRSDDPSWAERARGWMRVMHWDAFISMIVYTVATVAFYLLGAAVLFSEGRDPDGMRMVGTLAAAYVPVFGEYAKYLFLVGAIAVLYSTFLVANAGHARMFTDGLKVFGLMDRNSQKLHNRAITFFCVLLPFTCLAIFWSGINPVTAVAFAGMMQATMLPMIGFAALYCRWTATDPRLAPPRWWDVMLVLSFVGLFVVGVYGVYSKLFG